MATIIQIDETSGVVNDLAGSNSLAFSAGILPLEFDAVLAAVGAPGTPSGLALSGANTATTSDDFVMTFGPNVTEVAFTDSTGAALNGVVAKSGPGVSDFLKTTDGTKIFLYSYSGADLSGVDENNTVIARKGTAGGAADPNGAIVFAAYLDTGTAAEGDANATAARLWLVQYQSLFHPDATSPNDIDLLTGSLNVSVNTLSNFSLEGAPSGSNLFLMFGDGTPSTDDVTIVVTGKVPANQSAGESITTGDTVITSQGGGGTTIGTNNQMIDPNEGMYFTFVKGANTDYTIPNLSQNEADLEANIDFTTYFGATGASFAVVQLQPPKGSTLLVSAFNNTDGTEIGNTYIDGLGDSDDLAVNITSVTISRLVKVGKTLVPTDYAFTDGTDPQGGLSVDFTGATAKITGVEAGDRVTYHTATDHNRVLIDNVGNANANLNSSFDIGGFQLTSGGIATTPLADLAFVDDAPTTTATQLTGTVDEDGVTGGIAGGTGDVAGEVTTASGSVATLFSPGVDLPSTYGLSATTSGLPSLSSGGVGLVYSVASNTLTAKAGAAGPTVFTFAITDTATGAYTFTLVDQLDHATLNGLTGDNTENDLTIDLSSIIQITDKDGDTVGAAANALVITVDDDTPTASATQLTGTVDEDGVTGGIAGGTGDVAGEVTTASGFVATLFNSGADQPAAYSLSATTSGLPSLSSGGVALVYSVASNTLTAKAGAAGPTVFTFAITDTATGAYTFTLVDQLDHPTLNGLTGDNTENDLTIDLSSIIQATDFDGDTVGAAANALVITVDDDTPTASATQLTGTVDEDGVTGGIAGGTGDVAGEVTTASGFVATLFNSGADQPAAYSVSATTSGLPSLSSGGVGLVYSVASNTLTAKAGAAGPTVFTFAITDTATGAYTFTLVDQLDHATLNGLTGDNTENDLTIDLSSIIQITDKDGDTVGAAANALVITVDDDSPVVTAKSDLAYANASNPTPGGTGIFDYAIGADARSAFSAVSSDLAVTLTGGTVGATAITNKSVTWSSESASQAVFDVAFTYVSNPADNTTTDTTGTLTFDKGAGTYTLALAAPIASFGILSTATAQGFTGYLPNSVTTDNTQPEVTVAKLSDTFFVQFTGYSEPGGGTGADNLNAGVPGVDGGVADDSFVAGDLFSQETSWASVSGTAAGVAGDTMQQGEVLDLDFFTSNPGGFSALAPTATSSAIFMQFDGLDNGEDLVVILKLVDANNPASTTTRAVIADYGDIFHKAQAGDIPASFGFTGTLDNNDGLVVIENQDFNGAGEHWLIQGAQVLASTEGVSGTGINLNGAIGAGGASTTTQTFGDSEDTHNTLTGNEAGTWDGDVFKIVNIGFVTNVTPDAHLTFDVSAVDFDGDATSAQTLNVAIDGDGTLTPTSGANTFVFSDADTDGLLAMAMYNIASGFASGTDKLDFATAGSGTNYVENLAPAADLSVFVAAADTALNGTVDYYFGVVGSNGYLATDSDGDGITSIVKLAGVTDMAFGDIV